MSKMSIKVNFIVGISLEEALIEAREKAKKLEVAYIEFTFNGVHFAVSPQADIERGINLLKQQPRILGGLIIKGRKLAITGKIPIKSI